MHTSYRGIWLERVLRNSEAEVVVTAERFLGNLAPVLERASNVKTVIVYDGDATPIDCVRVVSGSEFRHSLTRSRQSPKVISSE